MEWRSGVWLYLWLTCHVSHSGDKKAAAGYSGAAPKRGTIMDGGPSEAADRRLRPVVTGCELRNRLADIDSGDTEKVVRYFGG
jgi:hypothetical protein